MKPFGARGLMSLLFHGEKAIDLIETAWKTGILAALDAGPVTLKELAEARGMRHDRLDKALDALEALGLVHRERRGDDPRTHAFRSVEPLAAAAEAVVGPASIERDRNQQPWSAVYGRVDEILRGDAEVPKDAFAWPPATDVQRRQFETSMAAGIGGFIESFAGHAGHLWGDRSTRVLDVGGGDGTLAVSLVESQPSLRVDVYNLSATEALVRERIGRSTAKSRIDFVGGDFLAEPLPKGYDDLSFVRVLHDWPEPTARRLLQKAWDALPPGGRVLISEELKTPARQAVQFFWSYFLIGVDSCTSRLRSVEWYVNTLLELGFEQPAILPGTFEIITAARPR